MAEKFTLTIGVRGANERIASVNLDMGEFTDVDAGVNFIAAQGAADDILAALLDVTEGTIAYASIHNLHLEDGGAGAGDVFEKATVTCYLNDPAVSVEKTTNINIPAPVIGIFQGATGKDRDIVDKLDADLIEYVLQLSQHAFVSDGEQIDLTKDDGIKAGRRTVSRVKLGS